MFIDMKSMGLYLSSGPPPDYMHYVIYMFLYFLSFNEQHKNLSLQKIFYLHCVCIFSLSYLGEWG